MGHGPSTEWKTDNTITIKETLGKWLFIIYASLYVGYTALNIISPELMSADVGSLNVAIVYSFGLTIFALLLAAAYNHVCTNAEKVLNNAECKEDKAI